MMKKNFEKSLKNIVDNIRNKFTPESFLDDIEICINFFLEKDATILKDISFSESSFLIFCLLDHFKANSQALRYREDKEKTAEARDRIIMCMAALKYLIEEYKKNHEQ